MMLKRRASSLALLVALLAPFAACANQSLPQATVTTPITSITVELATTDEERSRGLMDRTSLAAHRGMLFIFDRDGPLTFWMKNTLIPLDMVFIGADGVVRRVAANVPATTHETPDERIPRRTGDGRFVLELPAGEAAKDGIIPGVRLVLPSGGSH